MREERRGEGNEIRQKGEWNVVRTGEVGGVAEIVEVDEQVGERDLQVRGRRERGLRAASTSNARIGFTFTFRPKIRQ